MLPDFSVVIPTYRQPALLLECLNALSRQRLARDQYEIIVVDDENSPETAAAVHQFREQIAWAGGPLEIRYLGQPKPRGFAAARNRGWLAARGSVIAFTDDDCLPDCHWLSSALTSFRRGAQVMTGQLRLTWPKSDKKSGAQPAFVEMSEFISANCFCRKSVLERVGGFEEAFDFACGEDSDLQFRFIRLGIPISKCPEAVVVHPMRQAPWYNSLAHERRSRYDALLYKRHPALFRQRIAPDRSRVLACYASVAGLSMGLAGLVMGSTVASAAGFGLWILLSVSHVWSRLSEGNPDEMSLPQIVLTTLASPFLTIYWRLYGAIKYKVMYW